MTQIGLIEKGNVSNQAQNTLLWDSFESLLFMWLQYTIICYIVEYIVHQFGVPLVMLLVQWALSSLKN